MAAPGCWRGSWPRWPGRTPCSDPSLAKQRALVLEHYRAMLDHYGETTGVAMARKHIGWYTKGLHGSAEFRQRFNTTAGACDSVALIERFYDGLLEDAAPQDGVQENRLRETGALAA